MAGELERFKGSLVYWSILAGLLALLVPFEAQAKRGPAPVVAPIIHDGIRYTVPNDKGTLGYVVAQDAATGKELWRKTIYRIHINPLLEADVQWVFIKQMRLEGNRLILTNEKDEAYSLDLKTQTVRELKPEKRGDGNRPKTADGHSS